MRSQRPLNLLALLAALLAVPALSAQTLSDPEVDAYNCRMTTQLIGGKYQFTTNNLLVEGAMVLTNLGINSYKFRMSDDGGGYGTLPPNITNLMLQARDVAPYRTVFDMPTLKHYVFWCYTFANPGNGSWNNGFSNALKQTKEYNEIFALTKFFLTNYNNSGKSFYLGHWEGDWSTGLSTSDTVNTNPTPTALQGMRDWLNTRQRAVDDALNTVPHTNVNVFHYTEVNRVVDTTTPGSPYTNRVINTVVPYVTNIDYVSWSSYDIQNQADVAGWLDYANSFIPTNKAAQIPGRRLFIGEFGWGNSTEAQQAGLLQAYDRTIFEWGAPFSFYWQLYSNSTNSDGSYVNFNLIDENGIKTELYWLYNYYWNAARLAVLTFKQQNGRLPNDTEFSALAASLLGSTLNAPARFTLAARPPSQSSPGTARLNGSLMQGIYGDGQALVKLFWGPDDGGTNMAAWTNSLSLGLNTNAGPVAYAPLVTNLPAKYVYRYYATNAGGTAWSAPVHVPALELSDYGSRMQINFTGYNRSSTLTNFPVLVRLTPDIPGFSYSQFASATGGDLRFTDAGGFAQLAHEIDEWNINGTSTVWVRLPTLSSSGASIWAWWGNAAVTNPPSTSTDGTVWSDGYALVWHLKESGMPYADSAQNHPGIEGTAPTTGTGVIGKGVRLNGSSQYISPGAVELGDTFTLSAWVNVTNTANSFQTVWASKEGSTNTGFALCVNGFGTADERLVFETGDGTNFIKARTDTNSVTPGEWHLVNTVVDREAGAACLFVDGVDQTQDSSLRRAFSTHLPVNLGRWSTNATTAYYFRGLMDEARIETVARSEDWIWAQWMTSVSNSTLATHTDVLRNPPLLSVRKTGDGAGANLVFNWPVGGVGYSLRTTTNLTPPVLWSALPNQPQLVTSNNLTQWQISLPTGTHAMRYYQLWAP